MSNIVRFHRRYGSETGADWHWSNIKAQVMLVWALGTTVANWAESPLRLLGSCDALTTHAQNMDTVNRTVLAEGYAPWQDDSLVNLVRLARQELSNDVWRWPIPSLPDYLRAMRRALDEIEAMARERQAARAVRAEDTKAVAR